MEQEPSKKYSWDKVNSWAAELALLQAIIDKTELQETTKWGGIVYTLNGKNVLGIGGFKNYFTIWFFNGVFLKDEAKVLVNAQEGVTKALRQWRFTTKDAINEKLLLQYIHEAIDNEKAGLVVKATKKEVKHCPVLEQELKTNTALNQAFIKFSTYKQNEFWEYMATAKQEKTKLSRLEKIKNLVASNRGLNDQYK